MLRNLSMSGQCPLCGGISSSYVTFRKMEYLKCAACLSVFLASVHYLTPAEEKKRYLEHNNDIDDSRYRAFVAPLVNAVRGRFTAQHSGLDFGAGTGPVITKLLSDDGYAIEAYDPFFRNRRELLLGKYDYIVCCEVIEHFKRPHDEFCLLRSLLRDNGTLYCKTTLYDEEINFSEWYYKNDPTHLFFYHRDALEWIRKACGFKTLSINAQFIQFDT